MLLRSIALGWLVASCVACMCANIWFPTLLPGWVSLSSGEGVKVGGGYTIGMKGEVRFSDAGGAARGERHFLFELWRTQEHL
ncbi:unnamed protein product [Boreogadus saida]